MTERLSEHRLARAERVHSPVVERSGRRTGFLLTASLVASAFVLMGASCSGSSDEHASSDEHSGSSAEPRQERVETIPAVDVSELTGPERRIFVSLVNDVLSPCGDPVSVGRCAVQGGTCRQCVPAARYIVRLIGEGYERSEIEELYEMRYGRDTRVEVDTDGFPTRGAVMGRITIVEFSDFQCPHCGAAHPILQQILREYEGEVRLVFRQYPLPGHPRAQPAARAALAAGQQNKFWEMADLLFAHQDALEDADLDRYATQIGLDMERFHTDIASPEIQARIDADREAGRQIGVEGTPTFVINGRRFHEAPSALGRYVAEELDQ